MIKKKFILELDELPKYIIISNGRTPEVYENGEKVNGLISVNFSAHVDDAPRITVEKYAMRLNGE